MKERDNELTRVLHNQSDFNKEKYTLDITIFFLHYTLAKNLHITKLYINSGGIYQQVKFNDDKFLHILITRIL